MANALYPCTPWPIDPICCPDWPADPADWTPAHHTAQMLATIELWRAIGGIIGLCRAVMRPCVDQCGVGLRAAWSGWMVPNIREGNWYNSVCGCEGDCSCTRLCTVTLQGPVHLVESVSIGGELVPPDQWRLLTGDRVARVSGGCWPSCQDLRQPDTEGFTITYQRGVPPGPDAIRAVSMLACKRLADCGGPGAGDCGALPPNVTSMTSEGISMRFGDRDDRINTGLSFVNDWVASVNPYGLTEVPAVWSPDLPEVDVFYEGPI